MYKVTEDERMICLRVVEDMLKGRDSFEYGKYVDEILKITYSIGGDYSEKTLRLVAEIVLKIYNDYYI